MSLSRDDVRYGYLYVLGRPPESEEVIDLYESKFQDVAAFRDHLMQSPEYREKNPARVTKSYIVHTPPADIDLFMDTDTLREVVSKTASYWSKIGVDAPHWSVLSDEKFVPSRLEANRATFYDSGVEDMDLARDLLARMGRSPREFSHLLEFGCGVGRTTAHLASAFSAVTALDISPAHIDLARQHIAASGARNVQFVQVTPQNVMPGTGYDLWYSRLVLQHNPPPVTLSILAKAFTGLPVGGVAIVHVRTWSDGYRFKVAEYLASGPSQDMEMHATPQDAILALADRCGCRLFELHEEPDHLDNVTNIFVFEKPGSGDRRA